MCYLQANEHHYFALKISNWVSRFNPAIGVRSTIWLSHIYTFFRLLRIDVSEIGDTACFGRRGYM